MATDIVVPEFGESVVEATVGHWLKTEGQTVEAGEPVVELETEKVNTEVSPAESGILISIARKEGDTVHPGDILGVVEARNGATASAHAMGEAQPERREEATRVTPSPSATAPAPPAQV